MGDIYTKSPVLTVNIALSGKLSDSGVNPEIIREKLNRIVKTTVSHLSGMAKEEFGFSEGCVLLRFLSVPEFTDQALTDMLKSLCPEAEFHYVAAEAAEGTYDNLSVINGENMTDKSLLYSWICDQADFALVLSKNHAKDSFLHHCTANQIPCAVIGTHTETHILWTEKSLYDSYDDDKLVNYLNLLLPDKDTLLLGSINQNKIFGQRLFWGSLYKRYMKRYKAAAKNRSFTKDHLMDKASDTDLPDQFRDVHSCLLGWYSNFDSVALEYADKYHSSIYLRAVIPLILTVVIAIGFYVEPLFAPWGINIPGTGLKLLSVIAGLCFFIHAILNLYVYRLSENDTAKSWHKGYIDNRFIAEALRIAVHFMSYGIPINYTASFSRYGSKIKKESSILRRIRSMIRGTSLPVTDFNSGTPKQCLESLEELVDDQMEYHKSSANRYVNIIKALKSFGKYMFYVGFFFVILRGFFQCFISFADIKGTIRGFEVQPILKSLANMLALVFPAWAGYFSSKLSLCNFEGLYNNDLAMLEGLKELKTIINDKKNSIEITYRDIYELSKKFSSLMLYEVSEWYAQINTRNITRL